MGGTPSSSANPSFTISVASLRLSHRRSASSRGPSSVESNRSGGGGVGRVKLRGSRRGGGSSPSPSFSSSWSLFPTPLMAPSAPEYARRAHHAGSWYDSNPSGLNAELSGYLRDAEADGGAGGGGGGGGRPRATISPHAGFRYSGPTAAYAYLALREALMLPAGHGARPSTVVVLHPSHHVRLDGCAISGASVLETPIADLVVDSDLRSELLATGEFLTMDRHVDEAEHSGEMQYPYIAKAIADAAAIANRGSGGGRGGSKAANAECRVLPIMVGALGTSAERRYGRMLAPYLSRPGVFTVISSDFCHWGRRFGYVPYGDGSTQKHADVSDYIEWLDRRGMEHVESQRPGAFADYLRTYSNTICGRHPIGVWLHALAASREAGTEAVDVRFVRYAQSGKVRSMDESSVSYASAVARITSPS